MPPHTTKRKIYISSEYFAQKNLSVLLSSPTALHSNVSRKDSKSNTAERDVTIKNVEVLRARQNSNKGQCPNLRNTIY